MDNDTGVDCLSLIAHYHQLATDPAQLGYQFAEAEKPGTAATVSLPLDQLPITWIEPLSEGEQSQQRIETQQDLKAERARQEQLSAAIEEVLHQIASLTAELSSRTLNEIEESERQITALMQELNKVREINAKQILYAPVAGRVQQLAVHTLGGVVTEAQPLMLIVPEEGFLEVEVVLENKDIGFVSRDQVAEIKANTFPFTKYGVIDAEVLDITADAIEDERQGLVYKLRLKMHSSQLWVNKPLGGVAAGDDGQCGSKDRAAAVD